MNSNPLANEREYSGSRPLLPSGVNPLSSNAASRSSPSHFRTSSSGPLGALGSVGSDGPAASSDALHSVPSSSSSFPLGTNVSLSKNEDSDLAPDDLAAAGDEVEDDDISPERRKALRWMLVFIFSLQLFINFDAGGVPAAVVEITDTFNLDFVESGLLGSLVYLGVTMCCLFGGPLFQHVSAKMILIFSVGANGIWTIVFGASKSTILLLIARTFQGFTQAFVVIYGPVWTDEFAPAKSRTTWLAIMQGAVPFGVMLGYIVTGIISNGSTDGWRIAFYIQGGVLLVFTVALIFMPVHLIDMPEMLDDGEEEEEAEDAEKEDEAAPAEKPEAVEKPSMEAARPVAAPVAVVPPVAMHSDVRITVEGAADKRRSMTLMAPVAVRGRSTSPPPPTANRQRSRTRGRSIFTYESPTKQQRTLGHFLRAGSYSPNHLEGASNPHGPSQSSPKVHGESRLVSRLRRLTVFQAPVADIDAIEEQQRHSSGASVSGSALQRREKTETAGGDSEKRLSRRGSSRKSLQAAAERKRSVLKQWLVIARCYRFVSSVLGISALYFVVTGVQFWTTDYLVEELNEKKGDVLLWFSIVSATGPVLGVFFGGWIIDRIGGYKGDENVERSLRTLLGFGCIAAAAAIPAGYMDGLAGYMGFLWVTLFFGGAVVPSAMGIMLSVVPESMRSFASAVQLLFGNLLGYFLAPFLSGIVMEATNDRKTGVRLVLYWSLLGVLFFSIAWLVSWRFVRAVRRRRRADTSAHSVPAQPSHSLEEGRTPSKADLHAAAPAGESHALESHGALHRIVDEMSDETRVHVARRMTFMAHPVL